GGLLLLVLLRPLLLLHFAELVFYLRGGFAYRDHQLEYEFVQQVEQEPV
ncbi:MAG: hypothetical protein JWQ78_912, partial [Sediminibacterium sp.]|nr:hypothetical protein [Sediminibacterium sp.]